MKRLFFVVYFFIERLLVERSLPLFSVLLALVDEHIRRGSAWIRVVHACGHSRWRRELGNNSERERKKESFSRIVCPDCHSRVMKHEIMGKIIL